MTEEIEKQMEFHIKYLKQVNTRLKLENFVLTQESQQKSQTICELEQENKQMKSALEEIKNNFMCFRSCMIPFHVGDKDNLPHKMADAIQNYCESIMNKINEVIE